MQNMEKRHQKVTNTEHRRSRRKRRTVQERGNMIYAEANFWKYKHDELIRINKKQYFYISNLV